MMGQSFLRAGYRLLVGLAAIGAGYVLQPISSAHAAFASPLDEPPIIQYSYPEQFDIRYKECTKVSDDIVDCNRTYDVTETINATYGIEDTTYKDLELIGEEEVVGAYFKEPIIHKRTPNLSITDLSKWYLIGMQSIDDELPGPYVGKAYRGERDMVRYKRRLVQPEANAVNTCERIITPNATTNPDDPKAVYNELTHCVDQYIINTTSNERQLFLSQGRAPGAWEASFKKCQPFEMIPMPMEEQEYLPSDYYGAATTKILENENFSVGALVEPLYSDLGSYERSATLRPGMDYGRIEINDLTEFPYEVIKDPTHAFSPRWDFNSIDRDMSPWTASYGGDPIKAVRCSDDIITDVLSFRQEAWEYWMYRRIAFNIVCYYLEKSGYWPCMSYFDASSDDPPCPTRFDGKEKVEEKLDKEARQRICGAPHVVDLCDHIQKPLVPANKLKLREMNEENFPFGPAVGMAFKEYFEDHRPYMRCWDTGLECGREEPPERTYGEYDRYQAEETKGSEYAFVGVGREGEQCLIGGVRGESAITAWTPLKLYQMRSYRDHNINCLVKHETTWKDKGTEEFILGRNGATYGMLKEDSFGGKTRTESRQWKLSWRGYITDPEEEFRFPYYGSKTGVTLRTGLDDADIGDVAIFDPDLVVGGLPRGQKRIPYLASVVDTNNIRSGGEPDYYVTLQNHNHGKFPDVCGNTELSQCGANYTVYRDQIPPYNKGLLQQSSPSTQSCEDPYNTACVEPLWGGVKLYTPLSDIRR